MRPIRLTMTAFGPYRDREVIAFDELAHHRLFVVSGNTGAGKTSIFDAICFALYGDASGEDRSDRQMLRSQFAADDLHTAVELVFELRGRHYRVLRQLAHVKAGNKVATGDRHELYEVKAEGETPLTDRFIVSQVDEKLRSLIGLTKEQFSQIVMLPQGEFRKLLTSETENKEEILRKIFRTELYKKMADQLNEQRRTLQQACAEQVSLRDHQLLLARETLGGREGSPLAEVFSQQAYNAQQVLAALAQEEAHYRAQLAALAAEQQLLQAQLREQTAAWHQAEAANAQLAQLAAKRARSAELDAAAQQQRARADQLAQAERAEQLRPRQQRAAEAAALLVRSQAQLAAAEAERREAEAARGAAEAQHAREEARGPAREQALRALDRLQALAAAVEALEAKRARVAQLQAQAEQQARALAEATLALAAQAAQRAELGAAAAQLEEAAGELPAVKERLGQLRQQAGLLKETLALGRRLAEEQSTKERLQHTYRQADRAYTALETQWIDGQARLLAAHLHDGQPCPVCGSAEHPHKAAGEGELPTREELDRQRRVRAEAEQAYRAGAAQLQATQQQLQARSAALAEELEGKLAEKLAEQASGKSAFESVGKLAEQASEKLAAATSRQTAKKSAGQSVEGAIEEAIEEATERALVPLPLLEEAYATLVAEGKALAAREKQLEKDSVQLKQLRLELRQLEERLERLRQNKEAQQARQLADHAQLAAEQALLEKLLQDTPEDVRSAAQLATRLQEAEAARTQLEAEWKQAQQQLQRAVERSIRAQEAQQHASALAAEAERAHADAKAAYREALVEAGFASEEAYLAAILSPAAREQLRQQLEDYRTETAALQQQIRELAAQLEGVEPQDLEALRAALQQEEARLEQLRQAVQHAQRLAEHASALQASIQKAEAACEAAERQYLRVRDLYDVVRGENSKKMSFERFLQIEFLEKIIYQANERLRRMSGGQFYLVRSERMEKRGRQSGLGLDVYDNYTGQLRDVKSLSGGEKFNASLCLALGMADVIQAFEGGISLETMFIDEGFGSLDEESLGKAIDTLVELQQSGRMIGVISHMQELKQAIPAVLEVKKTREGHSYTRFVVR